jgi:5-methylcytosine-specific restriction endonuclease McrA
MPTCPDDSFLDILLKAVGALATGDRDLANAKATELAVDLPVERSRVPITPRLTASVMRRDFFSCRYCDARIIPSAVLRAASLVWPKVLPYQVHWKASATHPLYLSHAGSIDHIEPFARGGDTEALTNLATACWGCNVQKSDLSLERLGWQLQTPSRSAWDGLVGFYPALWNVAQSNATEEDVRFHSKWLPAFQ